MDVCAPQVCNALRGQKRLSDLELEFQMVLSHRVGPGDGTPAFCQDRLTLLTTDPSLLPSARLQHHLCRSCSVSLRGRHRMTPGGAAHHTCFVIRGTKAFIIPPSITMKARTR